MLFVAKCRIVKMNEPYIAILDVDPNVIWVQPVMVPELGVERMNVGCNVHNDSEVDLEFDLVLNVVG